MQKKVARLGLRAFALLLVGLVLSLVGISVISLNEFENRLVPEMEKKAVTVGRSVSGLVQYVRGLGIGVQQLTGMETLFATIQHNNPELGSIALTDAKGKLLFARGDVPPPSYLASAERLTQLRNAALPPEQPQAAPATLVGNQYMVSLPVMSADGPIAMLHIGIAQSHIQNALREILLDIIVVLVVSMFLTIEIVQFMAGVTVLGRIKGILHDINSGAKGVFPRAEDRVRGGGKDELSHIQQLLGKIFSRVNDRFSELSVRAGLVANSSAAKLHEALKRLNYRFTFGQPDPEAKAGDRVPLIRAPLFLFILAEELTRAFIPLYAKQLYEPIPFLPPSIVIALPVIVFMMLFAALQPGFGSWSERLGRRRSMLIGGVLTTIGIFGSVFAVSIYDLLAWRCFTAIGYTLVFIAAQGFVLDNTSLETRGWGIAIFINAIMVAGVCGPSIGGIISDRVGLRATFALSGIVAALSLLVIYLRMPDEKPQATAQKLKWNHVKTVLTNRRLMLLMLACSMPAKLILSAFCFYLLPVYLNQSGASQATIGRLMMIYAIIMIFIVPLAARTADRLNLRGNFVAYGGIISGLGGLSILFSDQLGIIFLIVVTLGFSQAMSVASQSALVAVYGRMDSALIGESALYGVFRLVERIGSAAGPLIGAALLIWFDFVTAMAAVSGFTLLGGLIFWFGTRSDQRQLATAEATGQA
jgi:predicted MFS family arabinose efflux permease